MKTKLTLGIALIILVFAVFVGCGSEEWKAGRGEKEEQTSEFTSFVTEDIYGEEITEEVFKDYQLTMVNVWGTFCPPCIEEMPHLGEIQKEYQEKGINIVGLVLDVQDEKLEVIDKKIVLAKEIAEGTGAEYPHMIVSEDLLSGIVSEISSIPTSFFLDSEGNFVGKIYVGARDKEGWVKIIDETLEDL